MECFIHLLVHLPIYLFVYTHMQFVQRVIRIQRWWAECLVFSYRVSHIECRIRLHVHVHIFTYIHTHVICAACDLSSAVVRSDLCSHMEFFK